MEYMYFILKMNWNIKRRIFKNILKVEFMPYDLYLKEDDENDIDILVNNLINFNQCFLSYDTLDRSRCQKVSKRNVSQREVTIETVKCIGLR